MFTLDEYKTLASLVGKLQHEYFLAVKDRSVARKMAVEEVAKKLTSPLTGDELESELARCVATYFPHSTKSKNPTNGNGLSPITVLYRSWIDEHDTVASDSEIAHFTGKTPAAAQFARSQAAKDGYKFDSIPSGWKVTRPAKKERTYTEKEVHALLDELIRKL